MIGQLIEARISLAIQRAVFGAIGAILLLIGLIFLTVAAWIGLAGALSALSAALIIGAVYFGLGLIVFAIASFRKYRVKVQGSTAAAAESAPPSGGRFLPAAAQAFMVGLTAGFSASGRRR